MTKSLARVGRRDSAPLEDGSGLLRLLGPRRDARASPLLGFVRASILGQIVGAHPCLAGGRREVCTRDVKTGMQQQFIGRTTWSQALAPSDHLAFFRAVRVVVLFCHHPACVVTSIMVTFALR